MNPEADALRRAMAKIPGLAKLSIPVENIPSQEEFDALHASFEAEMERELNLDHDFSTSSTSPAPAASNATTPDTHGLPPRSSKVSLRIPQKVLSVIRIKAARKRVGYQTYINKLIKEAAKDQAEA